LSADFAEGSDFRGEPQELDFVFGLKVCEAVLKLVSPVGDAAKHLGEAVKSVTSSR
jgi:hypothetical protein